jgi:chromosome segregation ATPase
MSIENAASAQEEEIRALQNENAGLKAQIHEQHDTSERNEALLHKITGRIKQLEAKIQEANATRKNLQMQLDQLCELTTEKDAQVGRLLIERNQVNSQFKQCTKGTNEISNRVHELEDAILQHMTEQGDLKRDAIAAQHAVEKVRSQLEAKDRELSDLQNEVVRLKIDKLNICGQSEKLERGLKEIVGELQQKDNLINQYEMQIRRNNADIEKRQAEVDRLNRLYDSLKSSQNGEEWGPLERKIRVLESKIEQTDTNAQEYQATWLKKQTELVALEHSCETIRDNNNKTTAHIAVLTRKRDRTRIQLHATEKEIERLQIQTKLLQREMSRLGQRLGEHSDAGNVLVEGNINFEAEILQNLQEKEAEAAQMESRIEDLAAEREQLADDLLETEKSIMLCEKKLQLAKEMRDALDPNYGARELQTMKKEIARMDLRFKQIKKQQQVLVQDMEHALKRRETIAIRGAVQKRLNKDRTRADLVKGITEIKREVKRIRGEAVKHEERMREHAEAQEGIGAELDQLTAVHRGLQMQKAELERNYNEEEKGKLMAQLRLDRLHNKARLLQATVGKTKVKSPDAFQQTMTTLKGQERQIVELTDILAGDFPHLAPHFGAIKEKVFTV